MRHNVCNKKKNTKKANFALWLVIWFNFERRKKFLETVLQMLLICVCQFSCSCTVIPGNQCSETCFTGLHERLQFKESFSFWCFCLVAINMHFVSARPSAIKFVQHLSETALRLCCKSLRILSMLSLAVLMVPSSANKSHFTDLGERQRNAHLTDSPRRLIFSWWGCVAVYALDIS